MENIEIKKCDLLIMTGNMSQSIEAMEYAIKSLDDKDTSEIYNAVVLLDNMVRHDCSNIRARILNVIKDNLDKAKSDNDRLIEQHEKDDVLIKSLLDEKDNLEKQKDTLTKENNNLWNKLEAKHESENDPEYMKAVDDINACTDPDEYIHSDVPNPDAVHAKNWWKKHHKSEE